MALADWIFKTVESGDDVVAELCDDIAVEGNKSLCFPDRSIDPVIFVHNQTLNDKPVSGAIKTFFYLKETHSYAFGGVFKYKSPDTFVLIYLDAGGEYSVGTWYSAWVEDHLSISFEAGKWYILETILDDENNETALRIKDASENVILERVEDNIIPNDWRGVGGGIGIFFDGASYADKVRFDLTKIYYP